MLLDFPPGIAYLSCYFLTKGAWGPQLQSRFSSGSVSRSCRELARPCQSTPWTLLTAGLLGSCIQWAHACLSRSRAVRWSTSLTTLDLRAPASSLKTLLTGLASFWPVKDCRHDSVSPSTGHNQAGSHRVDPSRYRYQEHGETLSRNHHQYFVVSFNPSWCSMRPMIGHWQIGRGLLD